jgi:transcriptional regulator with XRE-family HTH domain
MSSGELTEILACLARAHGEGDVRVMKRHEIQEKMKESMGNMILSEEEETLAWRLQQYRKQANLTQAQAGTVLGLDSTAITKIEHGDRSVSAMELVALARAYKVPCSMLLDFGQEPTMQELFGEAQVSIYALIHGQSLTPEQILHLGMFMADVAKVLRAET